MEKDKTTSDGFNGDAHIEAWSEASTPPLSVDELDLIDRKELLRLLNADYEKLPVNSDYADAEGEGLVRAIRVVMKMDKAGADYAQSTKAVEPQQGWVDELDKLLMEVSGILEGWHQDGTAWSEYDESVRNRVTEFRSKYTYTQTNN